MRTTVCTKSLPAPKYSGDLQFLSPGTEALELGVASTCPAEGKLPDRTCVWEQLSLSKEVWKKRKRRKENVKFSGVGPRPASQEEESGWFRLDKPTPLIIRLLNLVLSILFYNHISRRKRWIHWIQVTNGWEGGSYSGLITASTASSPTRWSFCLFSVFCLSFLFFLLSSTCLPFVFSSVFLQSSFCFPSVHKCKKPLTGTDANLAPKN